MAEDDIEAVKAQMRELGPIEDFIQDLATADFLPTLAVGVCLVRIDEAAPALLAVLENAAAGEALSDDDANLWVRGLHVLGGARDTRAFSPLIRLLRRPDDETALTLADIVVENLSGIVIGVFDGDVDALLAAIDDQTLDDLVRKVLFDAANFLTWEGRIPRDRMRAFLEYFDAERRALDQDLAWIGWVDAISYLGLRELEPLVVAAFADGRVPDYVMKLSDFQKDLKLAESDPTGAAPFEKAGIGYIEDVLVALEKIDVYQDDMESLEAFDTRGTRFDLDRFHKDEWRDAYESQAPVVNPMRHVGRNDPCPCGSGKKAKHCCLAAG